MGVDIQIVLDAHQVHAAIDPLAHNASPISIVGWFMTDARPFLQERIDDRFAAEGDLAVGGKWAPLRRSTGAIRASQGFKPYHPINRRTGKLYDYVRNTYNVTSDSAGLTLTMPGRGGDATLQSKLKIAQEGGAVPKGPKTRVRGPNFPAPPRPVVGLNIVDEDRLTQLLADMILPKGFGP